MLLFSNTIRVFSQSGDAFNSINRILEQNNMQSEKSLQRLSSGLLLWTDDPASKAIYEKLKSHIDFLSITIRNQQDLVSFYQVRDGYLETITNSLQRIRELVIMKTNGIYSDEDRLFLDAEIYIHYEGILKTLSWAQFNTIPLFKSWLEDDEIREKIKEDQFYSMKGVDRILSAVIKERAAHGALQNSLKFRMEGLGVERETHLNQLSRGDTDFGKELSNLQRSEIMFFSDLFLLKRLLE